MCNAMSPADSTDARTRLHTSVSRGWWWCQSELLLLFVAKINTLVLTKLEAVLEEAAAAAAGAGQEEQSTASQCPVIIIPPQWPLHVSPGRVWTWPPPTGPLLRWAGRCVSTGPRGSSTCWRSAWTTCGSTAAW